MMYTHVTLARQASAAAFAGNEEASDLTEVSTRQKLGAADARTASPGQDLSPPLPPLEPEQLLGGGAVLALVGVSLLPLADGLLTRSTGRGARVPGAVFFARWGFGHVARAMATWMVLGVGVSLLLSQVEVGFLGQLLAGQLLMGSLALVAVLQVRRLHPEGVAALGLFRRGSLRLIGAGLGAYVVCLPMLYGVTLLWPGLAQLFGHTIEQQQVAQGIAGLEGASLAVAVVVAATVAPFLEEIVFRGYLQPLLVQNLHAPAGIGVTALVFASLHGDAFLPILALALVLGWIQWRTHSTLACVAVHMLHNSANLLLLLLSSGVTP